MGLGTKAYVVGAILTFYSSFAAALGLGEITLDSALNQPLDAKIQLLHVRDLTEREILVGLASNEEFARAGVDRSFLLNDLNFNVDLNAPGGPVVRVTSKNPVREPFVNFLVVAQWPSGKLLREYTLLVDLPVFSGDKAAPVRAAPRDQARPSQRPSASTPAARPARPSSRTAPTVGEYGPVGANENLWSIATQVRPDSSVTVQQTMLALQKLNPEAFINNNINLLRRGQVLRVPDLNEIQGLSARDAVNEVAEQNRRWSQKNFASDEPSAQLEGSKSVSPTRTERTAPEGRIKLSSADRPSAAQSGTGAGQDETGARVVARELAVTQEELDAASRENAELESRLTSVQEQIETMEKLLEVSSEEMRALELAAQQTNEADTAQTPAVEEAPAAEKEQLATTAESDPVRDDAKEQAPAQPVSQSKQSWLELAMENMLYIAIGLGALIAGIALVFYLRNRDDGFDDGFEDDLDSDYEYDYEPQVAAHETAHDAPAVPFSEEEDGDNYAAAELSNEAETEDVVGECDIHIAYGQYEQAEEKLTRALEREPANIPVRLKLLEVFAAQSDVANFDSHFARIYALGDREAIDRASMLREGMDEAEPFNLSAHDTSQFEGSAAGGGSAAGVRAVNFDNEVPGGDNLGLADDTLLFDYDDTTGDVKAQSDDDELELGLVDFEDSSIDDFDDDRTVIQNRTGVADAQDGLSLDLDLPEDDDSLFGAAVPAAADEPDFERHDTVENSLDSSEDSFDVVGDDLSTGQGEVKLENHFNDNVSDELDDLDFDLDEISADLSFDDVELELEGPGASRFADTDDTTRIPERDVATFDVPEDDTAELTVHTGASEEKADFEFDESLFDVDEETPRHPTQAENAVSTASTNEIPEDFDLDRDLESAMGDSEALEDELAENGHTDSLEDLDFGDLGDLDIDDDQIDGGDAASFELADEQDLPSANNLAGAPLTGDADEDEPEAIAQSLTEAELEGEDDFGADFDLDDLDKDLGSLASNFDGDLASADALMDEPMTDFEEFDFEREAEPAAEPSATTAPEAAIPGSTPTLVEADLAANSASTDHSYASTEDFEIPDFDPENDDDSNLDFLSDNDETATKLDLARAYIDMGDVDGAKDILDEIAEEGNEQQKQDAETLLARLA